jgi:signal transduction histidine kinase
VIGQSILRLLPPDRTDEETRILSRLKRGERVDHYETVRVCKDGRRIDVSLTISPIRSKTGKIIGASKIARDITDQKRALERLAAAHDELSRANRMKADFISTLSHELRTPLNAIVGWIQLLREQSSEDDLAQGLEVIERNVRVQTQLIDDLLDMSRIEAGKITLDVQRLDLPTVVEAAIEAVRPAALAKRIRVTSAFSSVEGILMGDKNRLQQIVWNLLLNAIKFTRKGGRVHVTLERVNSHVENLRTIHPGRRLYDAAIRWPRPRSLDCQTSRRTAWRRSARNQSRN